MSKLKGQVSSSFLWSSRLVCLVILVITVQGKDIRLPPSILNNAIGLKYFRSGETVDLECLATAHPNPEFEWLHDNNLIRAPGPQGNILFPKPWVLKINSMGKTDEGRYQCRVFNLYGTSLSNITQLKMATISDSFGGDLKANPVVADEWAPVQMKCFETKSIPGPSFTWCMTSDAMENAQQPPSVMKQECLPTDRRIQIDDHGTLHFSYVTRADAKDGMMYKCNAFNSALDMTRGGGYAKLTVRSREPMEISPVILFSSDPLVVMLEGQELNLRCFFSARPEGAIIWSRQVDGKPQIMPSGRHNYLDSSTRLVISNVEPSDAGVYNCTNTNRMGSSSHIITVEVQAPPTIKSITDHPTNQNITEGNTAVYNCSPYAVPKGKITWWKNKEKLSLENLPMRMTLNYDMTQLTIRDVRRETHEIGTVEDKSDLMVIHCEVENRHGYAIYSGYLNVLKKTKVMKKPSNFTARTDGDLTFIKFECQARTDDSTPMSLKWFFDPKGGDNLFESIHAQEHRIILENDNQTLVIRVQNSTEWEQHRGRYKCMADNGYSRVEEIGHLHVLLPVTTAPPPIDAPLAQASSMWWILLLVGLILLLILLFILCCWCCWRNKGGEYRVDKKERQNGNDPIKELKNIGFLDYQRPSNDQFKGSRGSLGSSIKMNSDDEGSLNEYGDIDAGKFGEDGSFIGDYTTENRRNHSYQRV